jgi:mannose-6-phosphate isomerase
VDNGPYAGKLLTELHAELGLALIGRHNAWAQGRGKFPLLIKILDASQPLSVQVHPNDEYALAHEGNELGKTEMWVVLAAGPNAEVILGVTAGTTPAAFRQGATAGKLDPYLHHLPVKTGDHICVPAGSLHAIMGGLLIAEIQQNSNTTYGVYDCHRLGADGRPRALHLDRALDVTNFAQVEPTLCPAELLAAEAGVRRWLLCRNQYFVTERVELAAGASFSGNNNGDTLEIWGAIAGTASINGVELAAVRFALLPAALGQFTVSAPVGAVLLRTYVAG